MLLNPGFLLAHRQDDFGIVYKRPANGYTLHLLPRKLPRQVVASISQAHHLQNLVDPALVPAFWLKAGRKLDVPEL
jgi:hypothetical protein